MKHNEYVSRVCVLGDEGAWGIRHPAYCYIPLQTPQAFIDQPEVSVNSDSYYHRHLFVWTRIQYTKQCQYNSWRLNKLL